MRVGGGGLGSSESLGEREWRARFSSHQKIHTCTYIFMYMYISIYIGAHSIHCYLLERLSNISIVSIIPDLENFRDELRKCWYPY